MARSRKSHLVRQDVARFQPGTDARWRAEYRQAQYARALIGIQPDLLGGPAVEVFRPSPKAQAPEPWMARRTVWWGEAECERRTQRAAAWRRARARLFMLDASLRGTIRALWRTCPYPGDPSYLADLLHQIAVGRVDPQRPPWVFHAPTQARTTPNPATFEAAFRQIGKRQIGGGPKTTPADELIFCGNLGAGILFLTSRVRLVDPHESFYTFSNHRLRDSHVGRAGYFVDIEVRGPCSDADLALIEHLAQAADTRPVLVRRIDPLAGRPGRDTA